MTVYVYQLEGQQAHPFTFNSPSPWYGLTADTADELHPLAEEIGLYRHFYRPFRSEGAEVSLVGHYDLNQGERERAVRNGAQPISTYQYKKRRRQKAAALGVKLD